MRGVEGPTCAVALAIYGSWLLLTWSYGAISPAVVLPLGAYLIAWHGSLQHEAIHGHPTRSRTWNAIIAGVPIGLWLPYACYRESHLAHHACARLTDPIEDPESYYVAKGQWQKLPTGSRAIHWIMSTLAGRLTIGPGVMMMRFFIGEARLLASGDTRHLFAWLVHLAGSALVLFWVIGVCEIPFWAYVGLFVYPGLALTMLRSFTEHRPEDGERSTAITEAGPIFSLVFLNNNLHALHHKRPDLAWYELPSIYRRDRETILAENGRFLFSGYREILQRFGVRPKDAPIHPREGV
jgi:fatty acid desaturase